MQIIRRHCQSNTQNSPRHSFVLIVKIDCYSQEIGCHSQRSTGIADGAGIEDEKQQQGQTRQQQAAVYPESVISYYNGAAPYYQAEYLEGVVNGNASAKEYNIDIYLLFFPQAEVASIYPFAIPEIVSVDAIEYGIYYKEQDKPSGDIRGFVEFRCRQEQFPYSIDIHSYIDTVI
jgi:hypothetical protein